jgi:hypothetical protein
MGTRLERLESPGFERSVNDPAASRQRFRIQTQCSDACVLRFENTDGDQLQKQLAEFGKGAMEKGAVDLAIGGGRVHIDSVKIESNPLYLQTRIEMLCEKIRLLVVSYFFLIFAPFLFVGALAFTSATIFRPRAAIYNICYVLALACWLLVLTRTALLILIDATSMPALQGLYMTPAYFMLTSGAVLSCAAWLQLFIDMQRLAEAPAHSE